MKWLEKVRLALQRLHVMARQIRSELLELVDDVAVLDLEDVRSKGDRRAVFTLPRRRTARTIGARRPTVTRPRGVSARPSLASLPRRHRSVQELLQASTDESAQAGASNAVDPDVQSVVVERVGQRELG